ncbi:hypothetical protein AXF42_Ash011390 [Apostasia shenzhenica]|uniref:Uncharacterized protein n=1 Tax=Apostasia shenzhenica TaxID=1088818 RepID=A0A2I0AEC7_9ASPA|nr:hypothetical protein AXF42_Ash011390 [Apostasia shenzhenica]
MFFEGHMIPWPAAAPLKHFKLPTKSSKSHAHHLARSDHKLALENWDFDFFRSSIQVRQDEMLEYEIFRAFFSKKGTRS